MEGGFDPRQMMQFQRMMREAQRGQQYFLGVAKGRQHRLRQFRKLTRRLVEIELNQLAARAPQRFPAVDGKTYTCESGRHEVREIVSIGVPWPSGYRIVPGCIPCWRRGGRWCDRHNDGRVSYRDGTMACQGCIADVVEAMAPADAFREEVRGILSSIERMVLDVWLGTLARLTDLTEERCLRDAIATCALRRNWTPTAVMHTIRQERSITVILPDSIQPQSPP